VADAGLGLGNIRHPAEKPYSSPGEYSDGTSLKLETCTFAGPAGCGGVAGSNPSMEEQNE